MPRFAANLTTMFTEVAFLERFARAAAAGFRGVEYLFPYAEEPAAIRARLDAAGLEQALFNAWPGDWEGGERGLAALPGREADFRAAMEKTLAYAEAIGPRRIHIMAGLAQGSAARKTYVSNLKAACAMAPEREFVIEPINGRDMPGYHLSTSTDALGVLDAVGARNLRLQFDLYHAQIMEGDLTRRIEALGARIGHVQVAGVPGRHEPDTGELAFDHLMGVLDRVGYRGWVGCEYRPEAGTEAGLGWFERFREVQA